jgi:hypothetical protein
MLCYDKIVEISSVSINYDVYDAIDDNHCIPKSIQ